LLRLAGIRFATPGKRFPIFDLDPRIIFGIL
jgi:hypothetical protein